MKQKILNITLEKCYQVWDSNSTDFLKDFSSVSKNLMSKKRKVCYEPSLCFVQLLWSIMTNCISPQELPVKKLFCKVLFILQM